MDQISSNLLKKAFATWQYAFLSTSIAFYRNQNFESFWIRKWPTSLRFLLFVIFFFFFCLSFFSFSYLFAAVIDLLLGLLPVQKHSEKASLRQAIFTMCSRRKFCSEFFAQIFEHFHAHFRLHWADHSDLGTYHWKDLFLLQKLSIDDANFGQRWWRQKWNKGQGSSRPVTGGTGVNGLIIIKLITHKSIGLIHSGDLFLELLTIMETGCHSKQSLGVTKFRAYWLNHDMVNKAHLSNFIH